MAGYPQHLAKELERDGAWLLPATHLMMEESPDHAANRISRQWAGLRGELKFIMVQSHTRPRSLKRNGTRVNHWDLCFVYELKARRVPKQRGWWSEMKFVPLSEVSKLKFGRGHLDILKEAGYI